MPRQRRVRIASARTAASLASASSAGHGLLAGRLARVPGQALGDRSGSRPRPRRGRPCRRRPGRASAPATASSSVSGSVHRLARDPVADARSCPRCAARRAPRCVKAVALQAPHGVRHHLPLRRPGSSERSQARADPRAPRDLRRVPSGAGLPRRDSTAPDGQPVASPANCGANCGPANARKGGIGRCGAQTTGGHQDVNRMRSACRRGRGRRLCVQTSAAAAEDLTIGMITTLSGPGAGLGIDIRDGFNLARRGPGRQARPVRRQGRSRPTTSRSRTSRCS